VRDPALPVPRHRHRLPGGRGGEQANRGAGVGLLAALGGLGTGGKHLYVLAHPGLSCGIDPWKRR
jgi:hypothetical protein